MTVLVGEYGDIFWTLHSSLVYAAGSEISARVYVANITDTEREYMIMATVSREETVLAEFPVTVDGRSWFTVEADSVVTLPGALKVSHTDAVLTLSLYERETGEITDSVSTALTGAGTQALPVLPGIPAAEGLDIGSLVMVVVMIMMMGMVTREV